MTLTEIKQVFKIDLTDNNRTLIYNYLKTLYIEQERKKDVIYRIIGKDLKLKSHGSCINLFQKIDHYNEDDVFLLVKKAFHEKDIKILKEAIKLNENNRKKQQKRHANSYYRLRVIKKLKQVPIVKKEAKAEIKRDNFFKVISNLRHKKTPLNNIQFNTWNDNHWNEYHKIIGR